MCCSMNGLFELKHDFIFGLVYVISGIIILKISFNFIANNPKS